MNDGPAVLPMGSTERLGLRGQLSISVTRTQGARSSGGAIVERVASLPLALKFNRNRLFGEGEFPGRTSVPECSLKICE